MCLLGKHGWSAATRLWKRWFFKIDDVIFLGLQEWSRGGSALEAALCSVFVWGLAVQRLLRSHRTK